jgi:hypothetical protein
MEENMCMFPVTGVSDHTTTKKIIGPPDIGNIPEEGIYGYPEDGTDSWFVWFFHINPPPKWRVVCFEKHGLVFIFAA